MQKEIYKIDAGNQFGLWSDKISKFLYFDSIKEILKKIHIPELVGDYGGGNGILKNFIPHSISVDIDINKNPDIIDNILSHKKKYDLVILRYVLHYLNDYDVLKLFENIDSKNILVIQFTNKDLKTKYFNSKNEFKYFRTVSQLQALLPQNIVEIYSKEYSIDKEFYNNRLGNGNYKKHSEILKAYFL